MKEQPPVDAVAYMRGDIPSITTFNTSHGAIDIAKARDQERLKRQLAVQVKQMVTGVRHRSHRPAGPPTYHQDAPTDATILKGKWPNSEEY